MLASTTLSQIAQSPAAFSQIHFKDLPSVAWKIVKISRSVSCTDSLSGTFGDLAASALELRRAVRFNIQTETMENHKRLEEIAASISTLVSRILRSVKMEPDLVELLKCNQQIRDFFDKFEACITTWENDHPLPPPPALARTLQASSISSQQSDESGKESERPRHRTKQSQRV